MSISLPWLLIITGGIAGAYGLFAVPYGYYRLGPHTAKPKFESTVIDQLTHGEDIILLQALRHEITNNYSIYTQLKVDEQSYRQGESIHYADYETLTYDRAIQSNVFQYNTEILSRLNRLYTFLKMANNVFAALRSAGVTKEHRKAQYGQLFDNHAANEAGWMKINNDLGQYINDYEEIAKFVERKTLEQGTDLGITLSSNGKQLLVMNYGGENAKKISLKIEFNPPNIPPLKSNYPIHRKGMAAQFNLPTPKNQLNSYMGMISISFESDHSKAVKSFKSMIMWGIAEKKWALVRKRDESYSEGIASVPVGNIFGRDKDADKQDADNTGDASLFLDLEEDEQVWKIKNKGDQVADKYVVEIPFGKAAVVWDDVFLADLAPGKDISISLPKPLIDSNPVSISAQITFRSKGNDRIMYRMSIIKWDPASNKWKKGF